MNETIEYLKLPLILDFGTSEIKIGFSGDNPQIIKNWFGHPKFNKIVRTFNFQGEPNELIIGDDCEKFLGLMKLRRPIKNGIFKNEKEMQIIFNHIFSKLGINSQNTKEHPIVITEPLLNPRENRQLIAEYLFNNLGVPALIFLSQPFMSLLYTSNISGTILESGEGISQSLTSYEGYPIECTYERYNYGGENVTEYLKELLKIKGYHYYNSSDLMIFNEIKEKHCFCVEDMDYKDLINMKEGESLKYNLPDGKFIEIGNERFLAPEYLFSQNIKGKIGLGLDEMIINSIDKVDEQIKSKITQNIFLSGGNTLLKGLKEKLANKIKEKLGKNYKVVIKNIDNPRHSSWFGANILSTLDIFKKKWLTKKQYAEIGEKILYEKTF